jgi:two-component system response regulator FlrC
MSQVIRLDSLESERSGAIDGRSEFARRRDQAEREILLCALRESRGTQSTLADHLGISPRTLRYRIARLRSVGLGVELP